MRPGLRLSALFPERWSMESGLAPAGSGPSPWGGPRWCSPGRAVPVQYPLSQYPTTGPSHTPDLPGARDPAQPLHPSSACTQPPCNVSLHQHFFPPCLLHSSCAHVPTAPPQLTRASFPAGKLTPPWPAPALGSVSPRNPDSVQLRGPRAARADGDAACNSSLTLIMHSWLTDIPKNKLPSLFTLKHRNVFRTWC